MAKSESTKQLFRIALALFPKIMYKEKSYKV